MYTSHVVSLFPHLLPALLICHALLLSCCMQCAYPCIHGCKYPPLPSNNSELFNVLVQVRWCRPATPTLRRLRQEDYHPVKDKLCCTVNTKQVWADIIARSYLFPKIQRNVVMCFSLFSVLEVLLMTEKALKHSIVSTVGFI